MKILNDIACNLNWIQIEFISIQNFSWAIVNWIEFKFFDWTQKHWVELKYIKRNSSLLELDWNWVELNSNLVEEKWDANWCNNYWNFACHFHRQQGRQTNLWKDINSKQHLSNPFKADSKSKSSLINQNNRKNNNGPPKQVPMVTSSLEIFL
jgi:hypothetical protein